MKIQLTWKNGDIEIVEGLNVADAFEKKGWGHLKFLKMQSWKELNATEEEKKAEQDRIDEHDLRCMEADLDSEMDILDKFLDAPQSPADRAYFKAKDEGKNVLECLDAATAAWDRNTKYPEPMTDEEKRMDMIDCHQLDLEAEAARQ